MRDNVDNSIKISGCKAGKGDSCGGMGELFYDRSSLSMLRWGREIKKKGVPERVGKDRI